MGKDYYEVLEISKNATIDEIKRAFRKNALKWHPDKNGSSDAEEVFKLIAEAYDVLSNTEKRAVYDMFGENGLKGSAEKSNSSQNNSSETKTTETNKETEDKNSSDDSIDEIVEAFDEFVNVEDQTRNSKSRIGVCDKCNQTVVDQGIRCAQSLYHVKCFACDVCKTSLKDKSVYNIENRLICENDYLNTLDKCCECRKPIIDRIIKANGKVYHTNCFKCYVCGICLNGLPYSLDEKNRNYCINDYRKKFSPICSVCKEPIVPESGQTQALRIVALDRNFHISCFKCVDCSLLFSSNGENRSYYPLNGDILCLNCFTVRIENL